jgi:hypothetical protein
MTPKKVKLAYFLLCSSFILWLGLILSTCFTSGTWATPMVFRDYFMSTLFVGAAVFSSIPAMLLGLNYLGINSRTRKEKQNPKIMLPSIKTRNLAKKTEKSASRDSLEESVEDNIKFKTTSKDTLSTRQNNGPSQIASMNMKANQKDNSKSKDRMKAFFLFGETEFDHCKFELGYLKSLPKNKPIPDECCGCPKILECIALTRKKANDKNTVVVNQDKLRNNIVQV